MKKCVFYTTLSALLFTVIGLVLALVANLTIFTEVVGNIVGLFPEHWIVLIPPAVGLVFIIINLIGKGIRRLKRVDTPLVLLVSTFAYLLVAPLAYVEFIVRTSPPVSLIFTTGAGLIVLMHAILLVTALVDTFGRKNKKKEAVPEAVKEEKVEEKVEPAPAIEEKVEAEPEAKPAEAKEPEKPVEEEKVVAPIEYLDEEVEDEEDLEEETEEEATVRKEENKKAKATRAAKKEAPVEEVKDTAVKKDGKDKEYDRIYHIMKRAKDDRWIVKIAQSRKAIKIFDTQKEAIAYAEVLASNNNGVVRIFASKGANKGRIIV